MWRGHLVFLLSLLVVVAPFVVAIPERLHKNDLWHDEGWVANMIAAPTTREMILYESHSRIVPPLFLIIERWITQICGYSDLSLRLFPAFAHLATALLVAYLILRVTVSRAAALVALTLLLYGPGALRYAFQVKHYTTDCLVSAALLIIVHYVFSAVRRGKVKTATWYALLVLPLPLLSFVSSLSLACSIAALLLGYLFTRQRAAIPPLVVIALSVLLFILYDRYVVKPSVQSLFTYWSAYFPIRPTLWGTVVRLFELLAEVVRSMLPATMFSCVVVLSCVVAIRGMYHLFRDDSYYAVFVTSALVAPIGASLFKMYPLGPRLLLFAYPFWVFLVAYGAKPTRSNIGPSWATLRVSEGQRASTRHRLAGLTRKGDVWTFFGVLVACMYFTPYLLVICKPVVSPRQGSAFAFSRAVREVFLPAYDPSDEVVVYYGAAFLFKHYTNDVRIPRLALVGHYRFRSPERNVLLFEKELRRLNRKHKTPFRLWSVWDHGYRGEIGEMKELIERRCNLLKITTLPNGHGRKHVSGYRCRP